ncbi:hypothetical protein C0Q70_21592 [Pomacea canaliculata]|uniref:EGF-like domain-containing protein n=1 Tax=Pomacea canaliculata TaxID=400727 RepID=A0A2T7NCY4_POMCA|nr:hypothetical protein C0Q70_21592 [Pomacea canaliculata]
MELQLLPVEIQEGNFLSFQSELFGGGWTLPTVPLEVDVDGFRSCNVTGGVAVTHMASNQTIGVDPVFLTPGVHYFIVDAADDLLVTCESGLRLNVTVKSGNCHVAGDVMCSDRGLCLTQHAQSDYTCYCCGKYQGKYCFQGLLCEERVNNMCDVISCNNSGVCTGNSTHFHCACLPGFTGSHCEVDVNDCASSPCVNGLCVDEVGGYTCYCRPGFHGQRCELDYDECSTNPCENQAFCQDLRDNFTCHCHPGFTGRHCAIKVQACVSHPCRNGALCEEVSIAYKCKCAPGFQGSHCEVNVDDCEARPCLNGGTCVDRVGGYSCLCHEMHAGPNCQYPRHSTEADPLSSFRTAKTLNPSSCPRPPLLPPITQISTRGENLCLSKPGLPLLLRGLV